MAGTVVTTEQTLGSVKLVKFAWTSSAGGAADATTSKVFDGDVALLATDPGATAPADNYDVVVNDANGIDVLAGGGADRDTANTEFVQGTSLGMVANSKLTLAVTNAGNAKEGTVYVYIR